MIRLVLAAWLALCGVANAQLSGGVGGFPGPGTAHTAAASPAYTYRGNGFSSASGSVTDFTIDIGTASSDRLIVVTAAYQGTNGITSIVVDPAGANVSLTQDAINASGNSVAMYSGLVTTGSGSVTIRLTLVSASFFNRGISVWALTGLSSNLKKQSAAAAISGAGSTAINVTAGDFLFCGSYQTAGSPTFSGSTEAPANPAGLHTSNATNQFADQTIISTNASFAIAPGVTSNLAAASYR